MSENEVRNQLRDSLAERMDPAIGEASSGIGVLLSELVRRTLRGGVSKIEEEMDDFVNEKVDLTVADRMPKIEEAAATKAEERARDVAGQCVVDTEKRLNDEITQTSQKLTTQIGESGKQAETKAQEIITERIGSLRQQAEKTYESITGAIEELKRMSSQLNVKIIDEQRLREDDLGRLQRLISQSEEHAKTNQHQLQKQLQTQEQELVYLRQINQSLEERLTELERPRGMKAMFGKMFGKKKKSGDDEASEDMPNIEFEKDD